MSPLRASIFSWASCPSEARKPRTRRTRKDLFADVRVGTVLYGAANGRRYSLRTEKQILDLRCAISVTLPDFLR